MGPLQQMAGSPPLCGLVQWRVSDMLLVHAVGTVVLPNSSPETGERVGDERVPDCAKQQCTLRFVFVKDRNELN